jgi:diaminohydroxyphosphoribosylaminopyrimidine deaminase/5-amino-6-(5-phosphoribosylamino)uracil reductase
VWLFHTPAAPADALAQLAGQGIRTRCVAAGPAGVAWNEVVAALAEESIAGILVEGGGRVAASLLAEDRADRMHLFYAPKLYGNAGAPGFPGTGFPRGWELGNVSRLDRDVLLTVERTRGGEAG